MPPLRFLLVIALATLGLGGARAAEAPDSGQVIATIAPARTSIYIGNVTLTVAPMQRRGAAYTSTYTAKVFPYFFYNESGQFRIEVSDADLFRLASGQSIDFTGAALRSDGVERPVQGHATPSSLADGRVKVRVFVSRRLVLVFNTTYHLSGWQQ
jgi:hypothetical protein